MKVICDYGVAVVCVVPELAKGPTGARLRHIGLALETCQGGPEGLGSIPNNTTP